MEIFHHDGRPLQQVGIQPDVLVRPVLRGLRASKDEVLERVLRYLQTGR
jgi:C-terminal processing protease CtpA/Prc